MEKKKLLNLENYKIFIVFMMFVLLYYFQNNTEILIHLIPLLIIGVFLFDENIFVEVIMTAGLAFLVYEISKQRQDLFIFISIFIYFFLIFLQKISEKENQYVYFTVNFVLAVFRGYFISRLTFALPKKEGCIDLKNFITIAILFVEALFYTLYKNEKKKGNDIERKPLLLFKSYSLIFFLIYEVSIFLIYPKNWIYFICFILYIFIVLSYKIESDKNKKKVNK
jgi:membrane protein